MKKVNMCGFLLLCSLLVFASEDPKTLSCCEKIHRASIKATAYGSAMFYLSLRYPLLVRHNHRIATRVMSQIQFVDAADSRKCPYSWAADLANPHTAR